MEFGHPPGIELGLSSREYWGGCVGEVWAKRRMDAVTVARWRGRVTKPNQTITKVHRNPMPSSGYEICGAA